VVIGSELNLFIGPPSREIFRITLIEKKEEKLVTQHLLKVFVPLNVLKEEEEI
jgi:hypothetical protein